MITNNEVCIILPTYNPPSVFFKIIDELCFYGFDICIVNDGSEINFSEKLNAYDDENIHIIYHPKNLGKGAAIKSALKYVYNNKKNYRSIITADSDGQHSISDIIKISNLSKNNINKFILGKRKFDLTSPFRSRFGNNLTSLIIRFLFKKTFLDTQTGLRHIPITSIPNLIKIPNNKYDFEIATLIFFIKNNFEIIEVDISTIYLNGNKSSKFKPVKDSINILFTILKNYLK